jgi:hypothetical protein
MKLRWWVVGYLVAMAVVLIAPLASPDPDGLERVATDKGYIEKAEDAPYSVIADYVFPGVENEALATMLAGWVGVTAIFVLVAGGAYLYRRVRIRREPRTDGSQA